MLRRYGLFGSLHRSGLIVFRRCFRNRNYVFRYAGNDNPVVAILPVEIERVERWDDVEADARAEIMDELGDGVAAVFDKEFLNHGILWIGRNKGKIAAVQWSRKARFIENWFLPLEPEDTVIFATTTFNSFRGKRIAPYMMSKIIELEITTGGNAYVDCKIWNKSAEKGILRAGFVKLFEAAPI